MDKCKTILINQLIHLVNLRGMTLNLNRKNMKTKHLIFCILILFTQSTFSQNLFEVGLKGGLNLAQLKTGKFITTPLKDGQPWSYNGQVLKDNLQQSYETRRGYIFGAYARIGRKLYFGPEVYVATKGGTLDLTKTDPNNPANPKINELVRVSYTNIDVPLLVGYRFLRILRVNGGPVASLNVGSNQRLAEALKFYSTNNLNDTYKNATFSYQLGAGLDVLKFGLDVRYEGSITEISSIKLGTDVFKPKATGWLVTLSYKII
jgi:Outer membrane protein beta-barrel domain